MEHDHPFTRGAGALDTPGHGESGRRDLAARLEENWLLVAALGAFLIAGGVLALMMPVAAGLALSVVIGVVMLGAAVFQALHAFRTSGWRSRAWSGASAAVYAVGGALIAFSPLSGVVALSLLVLSVFLADGVLRLIIGLRTRPAPGWGWLAATGLISAAASAAILLFFLPVASVTLLGAFAGAALIMEGAAFLVFAFGVRPLSDRTVRPDVDDRNVARESRRAEAFVSRGR